MQIGRRKILKHGFLKYVLPYILNYKWQIDHVKGFIMCLVYDKSLSSGWGKNSPFNRKQKRKERGRKCREEQPNSQTCNLMMREKKKISNVGSWIVQSSPAAARTTKTNQTWFLKEHKKTPKTWTSLLGARRKRKKIRPNGDLSDCGVTWKKSHGPHSDARWLLRRTSAAQSRTRRCVEGGGDGCYPNLAGRERKRGRWMGGGGRGGGRDIERWAS